MFGYVQINQAELKMKDFEKYRSYYCGLCHTLKSQYGRRAQMLLNYDMTFLSVLLSGLYELPEQEDKKRCIVHPAPKHKECITEATQYAADMTILLAYQKAVDDWRDERRPDKRALALLLYNDYKEIRKKYPRQAKMLELCVRQLSVAEKDGNMDLDTVSGLTGKFLAEMFVWKEDVWADSLRQLGFYLGKFIYLIDAYDDLEKDTKRGDYNLFKPMQQADPEHFDDQVRAILEEMMEQCARAFERLPILYMAEIDRNILYSGVWVRCAAVRKERLEKKQKT